MVEPWYVECFREAIPIIGFIICIWLIGGER